MPVDKKKYIEISKTLSEKKVRLVAVSKTKPVEDILEMYALGQRDFGENYVQELVSKYDSLPKDIRWHFIGHLQSNKVKYIAPFVHIIHGIDSEKLLAEVNKQGKKINRKINCLLQVHIAQEETKFGLDEKELSTAVQSIKENKYPFVKICGLMGMASFSIDTILVRREFKKLKLLSEKYAAALQENELLLSMGMSADYNIAIEEGSNLVRIGSLLFGSRH